MDDPWAAAWDRPRDQDASWPLDTTSKWPATHTMWVQGVAPWDSPTSATSEQDIETQDQPGVSLSSVLVASEPHSMIAVLDQQSAHSTPPPQPPPDPVLEATDSSFAAVSSIANKTAPENTLNHPDDVWSAAWDTAPLPDTDPKGTKPSDQWEAARQEKEKLNRAVPPDLLDSLLCHCRRVLQETWPAPIANDEDNWGSGFDDHADIAALLAQLVPTDSTLLPTVQFSATVTARAMNEALKLTRHLPVSASSPLSRLLASKGSLEWQKSIKSKKEVVPDIAHVGWRVIEKDHRLASPEETKPRKVTGGLLSFWNRRASAIQAAPPEIASERPNSPPRSSLESPKSVTHVPSSRTTPPPKTSTSIPPLPPSESCPIGVATAPAPSAVSRFLNRFSRVKGTQHISLALSSDDLEFLSDIVPSASDPPNEDIGDGDLDSLASASNLSALTPKLPPSILPPLKQPTQPGLPSSTLGARTTDGMSVIENAPTPFQVQTVNHAPNVPILAPPLSLKLTSPTSYARSPSLSLEGLETTIAVCEQSNTPPIQEKHRPSSQASSRPHSPFILPPPQKIPPSLSIPPLLPPPPVSPPQTPRPSTFSRTSGHLSMKSTGAPLFHSFDDSDDEFSAFASFPPSSSAVLPSSEPSPSQRPLSPPSPPPRRTYERTHYPTSSSTSSILSPASQASLEELHSTKSSVSTSLDSFGDFASPPLVVRVESRLRQPSPPPLPVKTQRPPRLDTFPSHIHTPSLSHTSPTVHTSLMNCAFSVPSVSDAEHQRTQGLVNHAAARGGILWPNSPDSDEPKLRALPPPPPSSSTPPKSLTREEDFDLLGDGDDLGGSEALPQPLSLVGMPPVTPVASGVAGSPGKRLGLKNQLHPLSTSTFAPALSFSSGRPASLPGAALQPTKPKQTGGLSAQDLSFFEGL